MATDRSTFDALVARAVAVPGRERMRPVIEKELLHYDILFALDAESLLDGLTFQGGTALRLCHGAERFSEDLDFAGGPTFDAGDLAPMKGCIERWVGERYGLPVEVKEPARLGDGPGRGGVRVDRWQIAVTVAPARRDVPKQRVRLEVANVPARSRRPMPLVANHGFLPDGYADTLVFVESLEEIMADKIVSLVATTRYPRYRDLWDLRWLRRRGASPNATWVADKIDDYGVRNWEDKREALLGRLPGLVHDGTFAGEMSRFLPDEVVTRTLARQAFLASLEDELRALFDELDAGRSDD